MGSRQYNHKQGSNNIVSLPVFIVHFCCPDTDYTPPCEPRLHLDHASRILLSCLDKYVLYQHKSLSLDQTVSTFSQHLLSYVERCWDHCAVSNGFSISWTKEMLRRSWYKGVSNDLNIGSQHMFRDQMLMQMLRQFNHDRGFKVTTTQDVANITLANSNTCNRSSLKLSSCLQGCDITNMLYFAKKNKVS